MRCSWLLDRHFHVPKGSLKLVTIAYVIVGLIIGALLHAKVEAGQQPQTPAASCTTSVNSLYCFTQIDYGSGTGQYCTLVTGTNNFSNSKTSSLGLHNIIGTYEKYSTANGCYGNDGGFTGEPPTSSKGGYTLQTIPPDCTCSTLYEGMDDGQANFTNTIEVGYWVHPPSSTGCSSGSCGFFLLHGKWTVITDPHEGATPCNVTHVLAVNAAGQGVGYYETGASTPCIQHAFEYYPGNGTGGGSDKEKNPDSDIVYADLNPPLGVHPGTVSTAATSINQYGDIVGTTSWQLPGTSSRTRTIGWMYSDLQYYPLCYSGTSCTGSSYTSYNTFPEGINLEDNVVGYFTSTASTSGAEATGFFIHNPEAGTNWQEVKYPKSGYNYTIVRAITPDACDIAGWTAKSSNAQLHGFVGTFQKTQGSKC